MYLAIHSPMFGSTNIDSHAIRCPVCPEVTNDWKDIDLESVNKGDKLTCNKCKNQVEIFWGFEEPDHISSWNYSEKCPHRLCKLKYQEMLSNLTNI